jgi:hypothetical protein
VQMNAVPMLVLVLLTICGLGYYSFSALRSNSSSVVGSFLLGIGLSIFAAFLETWVIELYHLLVFSRATYLIFPGMVYCLPFFRLERRRVKYTEMIGPFLVGIPVFMGCSLIVGLGVACAMGDCL